jgi:hypothetical protein
MVSVPTDTYVEVRKQGRAGPTPLERSSANRVSCTADGGDVMRPCVYEKHPLELEQTHDRKHRRRAVQCHGSGREAFFKEQIFRVDDASQEMCSGR